MERCAEKGALLVSFHEHVIIACFNNSKSIGGTKRTGCLETRALDILLAFLLVVCLFVLAANIFTSPKNVMQVGNFRYLYVFGSSDFSLA